MRLKKDNDLAKEDRFKVEYSMLLAAQKQHDATAKKMNQNGQFMKFYPPKQGVRYTIIELVEVGCQMYDIDILTRTPAYMIVKYKLNDPMKKKSKSSARAAGSRTTSSNSSRTTSSNSRQRRDDHNMHQSPSSVEIEEISVHSTLSVIPPSNNPEQERINNRAQKRFLTNDDFQALHRLKQRGLSLDAYKGTYEVDDLVEYFKIIANIELSSIERTALRQMGKYYDDLMQNLLERNMSIVHFANKRNVLTSVLKLDGERLKDTRALNFDEGSSQSSQSSTGLTDVFKRQKISKRYKVVGNCGSILAKNLTMKDATAYIKEMGECMYCQGTMHHEPVSAFVCFFVCLGRLIYVFLS